MKILTRKCCHTLSGCISFISMVKLSYKIWEANIMKQQLIKEFNKLGIVDMEEVTELHEGKGEFVNLDFPLPCGQTVNLWDNEKTYYINQLEKKNSERCYGLTADEKYLLVCEYGEGGSDPEIVVFKRWS